MDKYTLKYSCYEYFSVGIIINLLHISFAQHLTEVALLKQNIFTIERDSFSSQVETDYRYIKTILPTS